ncbi:MAG: autotransporter outer membrane beta-barrel domain-containing protein [Candidatus Omnitrophica bacterium]|nr:autotransporter outer membrane beta-barrel domain-containing protein [Candidatus Omnitrophota bacterium]
MRKLSVFVGVALCVFALSFPAFAADCGPLCGAGIWYTGLAGQGDQSENKDYKAFQDNMLDNMIGFDKIMSPHVRLGAGFGYDYSNVNYKQNRTGFGSYGVDDHAFDMILTATYDSIDLCESRKNGKYSPEAVRNQGIDGWYADGVLGFTQHNYDLRTERFDLSPTMQVGKSDYHGQEYLIGAEAGYIYNMGCDNSIHITPYTSLDYNQLYTNLSKVKGLGGNDYKVKGQGATDLEQAFGVKIAKSMVSEKMGTFIPYVKAEWAIDYVQDIQSQNRQRNTGTFGAGIIFLSKGRMTLSGNWELAVQNRYLENIGYWKARYDF